MDFSASSVKSHSITRKTSSFIQECVAQSRNSSALIRVATRHLPTKLSWNTTGIMIMLSRVGGNLKRKASEGEETGKKYPKGEVPDLPDTVTVQSMRPDKEVVSAQGAKVDSYFYPQTKSQQRDLKIFLHETLPA